MLHLNLPVLLLGLHGSGCRTGGPGGWGSGHSSRMQASRGGESGVTRSLPLKISVPELFFCSILWFLWRRRLVGEEWREKGGCSFVLLVLVYIKPWEDGEGGMGSLGKSLISIDG
jgi:hypothetical protein